MDMMSVACSVWIDASRERVWQALTDPQQILQWFTPSLVLAGAEMARDGDKLVAQFGPMGVALASFETVNEPQQLTLRTLPDRTVTTTYTLQQENNGTHVSVTVSGFEALNGNAREERMAMSGAGWEQTLQNLKAFATGEELPFPYALVGPLFGYWRETPKALAAERSIWIDAPRERVWQAVTDPEQITSWFSPATPWQLTALEVGGRYSVPNPDPDTEMYVEIIELLEPPYQIATRIVPEGDETVVKGRTYTLDEENGGTRLTVTLAGYEQVPEEARWSSMEQDTFGFGMMLLNLKAIVEEEEVPYPFGF
jgi:uncharacterized protein YndB with AHSA1/START domain